ncbi:MAG TPA: Mu transposase C-terminal domain-containing protein [Streptosporangiaceae bacterium]|nr:Mu transposase C-terminal domain-containing protein [Streptosporangiaceae bacterium]
MPRGEGLAVSPPRPGVLRIGDRIRFAGTAHIVAGLSGTLVRLADQDGGTSVVQLAHLLGDASFQRTGERGPVPLLPAGLNGIPARAAEEAAWWQRHLTEVLTGLPPEAAAGARPRPQYDPAARTLAERDAAKAAELTELTGVKVSVHTVNRKRRRFQARGIAGVVDWRVAPQRPVRGRADPRVAEALEQALGEAADRSTRTVGYYYWRVQQILDGVHGPGVVPLPSRAGFYRLFARMSNGQHTTGSARTRQALASRPAAPFGQVTACRPGELVQIDSTPLDVLVLLDRDTTGRVELTAMIDLATRSVIAAVLRPATRSVDASLLLARAATPEPVRPGWAGALAMSRSVLPWRRLLSVDQRLEHAAARPVIVPETIVCDRGKVFVSGNFQAACASLGTSFQPAHPGTPTDKPHIERALKSVASLFSQFVSGYLGRSAEYRGRHVEREPLWSLPELQDLLDEWIVAVWQNRPHDGLRDPLAPGRVFTPNEKYAALIEAAGYVPVALSASDYIELLPATWRAINAYGIKISHRVYDGDQLNPFRRQPSGVAARKGLWEVHYDPYDISRIWVRNHQEGGWITLFWRHLHSTPAPFGELAWNHALAGLRERGETPAEAQIATAAAALLERAARGPAAPPHGRPGNKDRRVAARTRAEPPSLPPSAPAPADGQAARASPPDEDLDDGLADVIPLGIFDARKEAQQWW